MRSRRHVLEDSVSGNDGAERSGALSSDPRVDYYHDDNSDSPMEEEEEDPSSSSSSQEQVPLVVDVTMKGKNPSSSSTVTRQESSWRRFPTLWKTGFRMLLLLGMMGILLRKWTHHNEPQSHEAILDDDDDDDILFSPLGACPVMGKDNLNDSSSSSTTTFSWDAWWQRQSQRPASQRCSPSVRPSSCQCHAPAEPWDKSNESRHWKQAFARNQRLVQHDMAAVDTPLDIVFYGDSITEHWVGTDMGQVEGRYQPVADVYQRYFRSPDATLHGLALGIGGDRCTNLLYRLQHGEMPDSLHANIYWILIGTNDFGAEHCAAQTVTASIMHLVQTIRQAKPAADIVVNSILPRGRRRLSRDFMWRDIAAVNHALSCYVQSDARVHFFNATNYFTTADDAFVNMTLMPDALRPNGLGSEKWAYGMTEFALFLLSRPNGDNANDKSPTVKESSSTAVPVPWASCQKATTHESSKPNQTSSPSWQEWVASQALVQDRCVGRGINTNKKDKVAQDCCPNPLEGQARENSPGWIQAHRRNVALLQQPMERPWDLILYGDSITEYWTGYSMGSRLARFDDNAAVYADLWQSNASAIRGLGLGIAADRVVNLLYRLEHGELPAKQVTADSLVLWLLIGTNDLVPGRCNVDMVTAGILQVVTRLQQAQPHAHVVLNSILPKGKQALLWNGKSTWTSIATVNERLACFADAHAGVSFFNATALFVTTSNDNGAYQVNASRFLPDHLHPSAEGYRHWGHAMVAWIEQFRQSVEGEE